MANVGVQNCQHHANRIASINSYRMGLHGKNHPILRAGSSYIPWSSHGNLWKSPEKKHWISVKSHETKLHIFSTLSTWYLLSNIFSLYKPVLPAFLVVKSPFLCWLPYSFRSCSWGTIWFPHLWIHLNTGESQKKTNTLGQPWLGGLCSPFFCWGEKNGQSPLPKHVDSCGLPKID